MQKTAYDWRISDWSSDVCSSDLQSPLSRAIKELESDLGAQLFERTTRSTRLTWAGQVFLEDVHRVFAALDQARVNVKAAANGYHGTQIRRASGRERVCQYV